MINSKIDQPDALIPSIAVIQSRFPSCILIARPIVLELITIFNVAAIPIIKLVLLKLYMSLLGIPYAYQVSFSVVFHSLIVYFINLLLIQILSIWITNIVYTPPPLEKFSQLLFLFFLPYCINIDFKAESSLFAPLTTVNLVLTHLMRARTAIATWAHAYIALGIEPEYLG